MRVTLVVAAVAAMFALSTVWAGGPTNLENPPTGTAPQQFAHDYKGCLGGLRSAIARGDLSQTLGVSGFSGDFNPGKHQGTVGEEEFLKANVPGIHTSADLKATCKQYERSR